jgi:metallo-beta-lactamase class B
MSYVKQSLGRSLLLMLVFAIAGCGNVVSPAAPQPEPTSTLPSETREPTSVVTSPVFPERFDLDQDLYVREVQEGVFIITHSFPWAGNSLLVEMKNDDLVLVDTPYTPEATQEVLDWIEGRLGNRNVTAINTGYHYDNLGGNSYLVEQSIPVFGSDLTAKLLDERGDQLRAMTLDWLQGPEYKSYYQVHQTLPYVAPTHLFELDQGLQLDFGAETVQVYYPGPSHAPDNVVVYFPNRKILFGGCMIIGTEGVGNTSDADLASWPEAVRDLAHFDFDILVPGHGERYDPALLEHTVDLLINYQQ